MYYKLIDSFELVNDSSYLVKVLKLYHNDNNIKFHWVVYRPEVLLDYGYDISLLNFFEGYPYDSIDKEHIPLLVNNSMICYDIEDRTNYIEVSYLNMFLEKINGINRHYEELSNKLKIGDNIGILKQGNKL